MVNYDLPWNPNRIEQRFGRIQPHWPDRTCHLWNLVADETREGDVYRRLLEKLAEARSALGGQVYDVLGRVQFDGKPLRELLIQAIRFGEQPETRAYLTTVVEQAMGYSSRNAPAPRNAPISATRPSAAMTSWRKPSNPRKREAAGLVCRSVEIAECLPLSQAVTSSLR